MPQSSSKIIVASKLACALSRLTNLGCDTSTNNVSAPAGKSPCQMATYSRWLRCGINSACATTRAEGGMDAANASPSR